MSITVVSVIDSVSDLHPALALRRAVARWVPLLRSRADQLGIPVIERTLAMLEAVEPDQVADLSAVLDAITSQPSLLAAVAAAVSPGAPALPGRSGA